MGMPKPTIHKFTFWEGSPPLLMSREEKAGANIAQADISSISYAIFSVVGSTVTSVATGTLTVANVVYDALQTGAPWTEDTTGYNFRWDVAASVYTFVGGVKYRFQVVFNPASGEDWPAVFEGNCKNLY